ncbi:MAG: 2-oxoglutarate dehydrogenase E1 subunit family protein, partial [Actinomycetota bacterium]
MTRLDRFEFGPNVGLVDELYRRYLRDPSSVSEAWREFFDDYQPTRQVAPPEEPRLAAEAPAEAPTEPAPGRQAEAPEEAAPGQPEA